jgi:hypothetical protein
MTSYTEALQACQAQSFKGLAGKGYPVAYNSYAEQALVENYFKKQSGGALTAYWIGLSQPWAITPGTGTWCVALRQSRRG